MARIVFETDINTPPSAVATALNTQKGIAGWWTEDVEFDGGVGSTMTLRFSVAPAPFALRVDEVSDQRVHWTSTGDFPPHWVGTTVTWTLTPNDSSGTKVHFNHDGWASDEGPFPSSALTWARLQDTLKTYVETGQPTPLFTSD
jgi:uncharacterized protein YndB with AHSA1/START domain